MIAAYVVSDLRADGHYYISAILSRGTIDKARKWAKADSRITRIHSKKILATLDTNKKLPSRYVH